MSSILKFRGILVTVFFIASGWVMPQCLRAADNVSDAAAAPASPASAPAATQPAPAAWAAKPVEQWPRMVLMNRITIRKFLPWEGIAGFLIHLPTGQTVGITTFSQLVQGVNLDNFAGSVASWSMALPSGAAQRVLLHQLLLPPAACRSFNCVVLYAGAGANWPTEALTPSPTPARLGQHVYLVTNLGDKTGGQKIYPATIMNLNHPTPGLIAFAYQANVPPGSFSGSPIVDESGHVVAIQESYYPEATSGNLIMAQAFQISTILAVVQLPPVVQSEAASQRNQNSTTATTRPAIDADQQAESALKIAEAYIAMQRYDLATRKLQAIIRNYANTPAAKEAQTQLDAIKDKTPPPAQ